MFSSIRNQMLQKHASWLRHVCLPVYVRIYNSKTPKPIFEKHLYEVAVSKFIETFKFIKLRNKKKQTLF